MSRMEILEEMLRYVESEQKHGRLLTVSFFDVWDAADSFEQTRALLQPAVSLPPKVGVFRRIASRIKNIILASAPFAAGIFIAGIKCMAVGILIGSAMLWAFLAHAGEYTAVGRDTKGEMVMVEFDETDKRGNLSGVMWRGMDMVEVDGKWCGKGLARFDDVKVEVVK